MRVFLYIKQIFNKNYRKDFFMSSLKDNKTCALLEQYLSYLTVVKGRSPLTSYEYRVDTLMFFEYVKRIRGVPEETVKKRRNYRR